MVEQRVETDILIIGAGIAGSFAAIKAKENGANKVTVVSKGRIGADGASTFGAGIYWAVLPGEDREAAYRRMATKDVNGAGLHDQDWLDAALDEYYERAVEMDKWGVKWLKTPDGQYKRLFSRWDEYHMQMPGPQVMEAMAEKVIRSGVEVIGNTMITDLLTEGGQPGGRVIGAVGFDVRTGEFKVFDAKCVVLASGPCSFKAMWSGHRNLAGEGYMMALRAGAVLGGFEMGSSHIVTGVDFDLMGQSVLYGLGACLTNARDERFMSEYYPESVDTATTARMSASAAMEVRAGRGPIYLDMTHWTSEQVDNMRKVYPLTVRILEQKGVLVGDKIVKRIEQTVAWVGTVTAGGGLKTNTDCETTLEGLFACGDAMTRRMHFPFMIPGATVSGARAGRTAARYAKEMPHGKIDDGQVQRHRKLAFAPTEREDGMEPDHLITKLLETIQPYDVTVIARADRLEKAIAAVQQMREEEAGFLWASDPHYLRLCNEARSMIDVAELYLRSRLLRQESRDSCLREDYPYIDNVDWLKWTYLSQENGRLKLWTEDLPLHRYKMQPERTKRLHPVFEVARKRGVPWG